MMRGLPSAFLLVLAAGCGGYTGPATRSVIVADMSSYATGTAEQTLHAAAHARLAGMTRAQAIAFMQQDHATCARTTCTWTATSHPPLVSIGPPFERAPVQVAFQVTVMDDPIRSPDDLVGTIHWPPRTPGPP
jgi:hypothetical protein